MEIRRLTLIRGTNTSYSNTRVTSLFLNQLGNIHGLLFDVRYANEKRKISKPQLCISCLRYVEKGEGSISTMRNFFFVFESQRRLLFIPVMGKEKWENGILNISLLRQNEVRFADWL